MLVSPKVCKIDPLVHIVYHHLIYCPIPAFLSDGKWGSGSHEHDSPFPVVAMEKERETRMVHEQRFGERERLAHETSQTLSQGVIPTLHMSGFPGFLSDCAVLLFWNDRLIGLPKIGVAVPSTVSWWNGLP